jgi:hypothetical protein
LGKNDGSDEPNNDPEVEDSGSPFRFTFFAKADHTQSTADGATQKNEVRQVLHLPGDAITGLK